MRMVFSHTAVHISTEESKSSKLVMPSTQKVLKRYSKIFLLEKSPIYTIHTYEYSYTVYLPTSMSPQTVL